MVTITDFTETSPHRTPDLRQVTSDPAAKTETVEMEMSTTISAHTHVFIGVQMFDIAGALIVDSAGTFTVTVQMVNTKQYEAPTGGVIDATAPTTVNLAGNIFKIKVVPASLSTTVTYKVVVTANKK